MFPTQCAHGERARTGRILVKYSGENFGRSGQQTGVSDQPSNWARRGVCQTTLAAEYLAPPLWHSSFPKRRKNTREGKAIDLTQRYDQPLERSAPPFLRACWSCYSQYACFDVDTPTARADRPSGYVAHDPMKNEKRHRVMSR